MVNKLQAILCIMFSKYYMVVTDSRSIGVTPKSLNQLEFMRDLAQKLADIREATEKEAK